MNVYDEAVADLEAISRDCREHGEDGEDVAVIVSSAAMLVAYLADEEDGAKRKPLLDAVMALPLLLTPGLAAELAASMEETHE